MKKILSSCILLIGLVVLGFAQQAEASQPNFFQHVAKDVVNEKEVADAQGRVERLYGRNVDRAISLQDNMKALFYPTPGGGQIWGIARVIAYGLLVLAFVYYGITIMIDAENEEEGIKNIMNLVYVGGGAAIFFGAIWLIDTGMNLTGLSGSADFVNTVENVVMKNIFAFFKAFAFFLAIIMLIRNGYQIMNTVSKEEKLEKGKDAVLNVVIALSLIKVIDYVYFIAQLPDFKVKATETIMQVAKIVGFIMGAFFLLSMFYAGIRLIIDGGKGEGFAAFKKTAFGVFLGTVVFFLFLLISYQIVQEFA